MFGNQHLFAKAETAGLDLLSEQCQEKLFPVTSGGYNDEKVSCMVYDKTNEQIIIAGNTTSDNYAPAVSPHGFVYALDFDANWKWGNFFYNLSNPITTISGCQIDGDDNLVLLGQGNQNPIILDL